MTLRDIFKTLTGHPVKQARAARFLATRYTTPNGAVVIIPDASPKDYFFFPSFTMREARAVNAELQKIPAATRLP